jgi:hypothetical protein
MIRFKVNPIMAQDEKGSPARLSRSGPGSGSDRWITDKAWEDQVLNGQSPTNIIRFVGTSIYAFAIEPCVTEPCVAVRRSLNRVSFDQQPLALLRR